ncbi:MAG: 50S ribosomal protein L29 [Rhodospirillales bacterium]|nr:50S ribosomal protein L29 [Rhodospirillales bacterium]
MNGAEVKQKTDDELSGLLTDLKKETLNLRFQQSGGQLESTARVRVVRRDIARVLSEQNVRRKTAGE